MIGIVEMLRAQFISRWTIIAVTRPQSLAEHTFNVTMMMRDLCHRVKWDDVIPMKAAMEHDLDEILTGDFPATAKILMREKGIEPKQIEGPQKNVDQLLPEQVVALKCLDILESMHFLHNFGTGVRSKWALDDLESAFYSKAEEVADFELLFQSLHDMRAEIMEAPNG
jgi:5'-deoxynucleotidase YfbR-like HD superfamily hydrolase